MFRRNRSWSSCSSRISMKSSTGKSVELAYVDQGYTGQNAADAAEQHGIRLEVVKHPTAKRGFVLLPRRWVVERSFAWGRSLPPLGPRLRTAPGDVQRTPLHRLHYAHERKIATALHANFITGPGANCSMNCSELGSSRKMPLDASSVEESAGRGARAIASADCSTSGGSSRFVADGRS
jgi:transposase